MKKEELIHIHMLLAQLKKYCEENGWNCDFKKYRELNISPFQVHRSKEEHKQAIFVLGTELASLATQKLNTEADIINKRWKELQLKAENTHKNSSVPE